MPEHPTASPRIPRSFRIALGFDFGRVRIGVAVGEAVTGSARPLCILLTRQHEPDWDAIARLIQDWRPDGLVVGVPHHADASASEITEAALQFSGQLYERFQLPVATMDERLSSWEAGQRHFATTPARRRQKDQALDAQAAAVILESWFNHHQQSLHSVS